MRNCGRYSLSLSLSLSLALALSLSLSLSHLVAQLEVKVRGLGVVAQVHTLPCVPDDVLCTRVLVVATTHEFRHSADKGGEKYESSFLAKMVGME